MGTPVITVENLGKRYRIQHQDRNDLLRDRLSALMRNPLRFLRAGRQSSEEFWALRDVSFQVKPGEVLGIIGRNGAGKSTLLKILSRITEPSTGKIVLEGRVASLLEVGTGFHGELSGRENIFLNGAILGMSRAEIRGKFDEIVAFSEVEKFLDTPVKRYSSGMYVRLAFAVAAHLDPEILIVDEVLAVGDAAFQKKCLGKLREVAADQGRTVLFVSHNMVAVQGLCTRGLLLASGQTEMDATASTVVSRYLRGEGSRIPAPDTFHGKDPALRFASAAFQPEDDSIRIGFTLRTAERRRLAIEFILLTTEGTPAAFANVGTLEITQRIDCPRGDSNFSAVIDVRSIANGTFILCAQLVDPFVHVLLRCEHPIPIEIARQPKSSTQRILELNWQSGVTEVPLRLDRLPQQ